MSEASSRPSGPARRLLGCSGHHSMRNPGRLVPSRISPVGGPRTVLVRNLIDAPSLTTGIDERYV